ncbi:MAG: DUF4129 domain-containing protein [Thermoplasmata archaeon]
MSTDRRTPWAPPILFVVLGIALAVGAAASLIAGAARSGPFQAPTTTDLFLTPEQVALVFLVAMIGVGALAYWAFFGNHRVAVPGRIAVTLFAVILLGIIFAAFLRLVASASGFLNTTSGANNSSAGGTGSMANGTAPGNLSGPGGPLGFLTPHLPPWALFAVVAAGALVVTAVAVPSLWRRASKGAVRRRATQPVDRVRVDGALAIAARQLEEGSDPRSVVIHLYGTLLARVAPIVGGVDEETPEEIRIGHLVQLGIRSGAATTLTRLFEEARYSSHPLGPDVAERARIAIREAREDLETPRTAS